ncbi:hypothetical protein Poli38472_013588 [Pythium oligandrum]|uniref:Uncharacterized protein n=1 Tax=Pythium oligandrum TaxID=41045 RepID=A0A8K1FF07_PYTOL|nr:hypothetical protein Poli38472_013588 [Pythium oligandrum]|eukprot:TMW61125.1 hypothetical protein Poli38472_013588 [Pythium oligandrum]
MDGSDVKKEIEALERVLFRLASVDDERLLVVLDALLPKLLTLFPRALNTPLEQQLKDKVLEVIAHVKTRLSAITSPKLPLPALAALLEDSSHSVFTHNFAFLFIEMGFASASREEQTATLAQLVGALDRASTAQQETFFRCLISALPVTDASAIIKSEDAPGSVVVFDFLLDLVLYQPSSPGATSTTTYGLMPPRIERLQRVKINELKREALYDRQLLALQFIKQLPHASSTTLLHYVAGIASYHHVIKSYCEDQVHRVLKEDTETIENSRLCRELLCLVLGSQTAQTAGAFQVTRDTCLLSNRIRLADPSLLQAITVLSQSKAGTNVVPLLLQTICHLMFGTEPSRPLNIANRVKIAGANLCAWTFLHCELQFLTGLFGPVLQPTLLRTLMDPNADMDAANATFWREFRQGVYDSLAMLASRAPTMIASSEQAFQVLIVRCLVEEQQRMGANALKAFGAMREAYGSCAERAVLAKLRSELIGLVNGIKIYDPSKHYERVRAAVAEWALVLIERGQGDGDDIELRFALLKMSADKDEAVRLAAQCALYAQPLPSVRVLAERLRTIFSSKDLKNCVEPRVAEQCLTFCDRVITTQSKGVDPLPDHHELMAYFVETLVQQSTKTDSAITKDTQRLCETLASILTRKPSSIVVTLIHGRAHALANVAQISTNRVFLQNVSQLVRWSFHGGDQLSSDFVNVIESLSSTLSSASSPGNELCAALYVIGATLSIASENAVATSLSNEDKSVISHALSLISGVLKSTVVSTSHFAGIPRGEDAQNALLDRLRSAMDSVALAHEWIGCTSNPDRSLSTCLAQYLAIVEWKLSAIGSDGNLKQKLTSIRSVALENIGVIVQQSATSSEQELRSSVLEAVLKLGQEASAELQFTVATTLLGFGSTQDTAISLLNRIVDEHSTSRFPSVRRSSTIWLLSLCAAGLAASDVDQSVGTNAAWAQTFSSEVCARTIIAIHEHFVTMLNDTDAVAKESAVKGLAYLRLRAPTTDLGDEFSDSLFRRLRCFRAFAAQPVAPSRGQDASDDVDDDEASPTAQASASQESSASTTIARDTVENAAYREVSNVAADIGDPELMYSLLYLSTMDSVWGALKAQLMNQGATTNLFQTGFSFITVDEAFHQSIIEQANNQWMTEDFVHRRKLVPWLFLLKHHANPKVTEVMTNLWNVMKGAVSSATQQEKTLVKQHWNEILQFVLKRLELSRNFKYREAACGALLELLNGASADDLRSEFVRLWKLTARSVDDVMEAVSVAGLKLFRALGELSLRVASNDNECRFALLEYLISEGMVSKNVMCRALSIDLLLRLMKELPASAVYDRLAALMLKLLEYLSSLEMPELQYAQFHVDKKDQLERLRVSLSQSGPVGQLLEHCTVQLKALAVDGHPSCLQIVEDLCRGLSHLLKFGVGLNTRVGTANFVATLAAEVPFELRKSNGAEQLMTRALIPYVGDRSATENDLYGDDGTNGSGLSDALVLQSYCRATAYLSPLVSPSVVKAYVRDGIFAFHSRRSATTSSPSEDLDVNNDTYSSRFLLVSALATKELVAKCPPLQNPNDVVTPDERNEWYSSDVFPAAFIGQFAGAETLRTTWTAVMEELPPTILYADPSLTALTTAIGRLVRHPAWDTRRQAIKALQSLFAGSSVYRTRITASQLDQIWQNLLQAVPGRLWRGRGVLLEALVAVALVRREGWTVLVSLLLEEADRAMKNRDTEYLESGLVALSTLAGGMPATEDSLRLHVLDELRTRYIKKIAEQHREIFELLEATERLVVASPFRIDCEASPPAFVVDTALTNHVS